MASLSVLPNERVLGARVRTGADFYTRPVLVVIYRDSFFMCKYAKLNLGGGAGSQGLRIAVCSRVCRCECASGRSRLCVFAPLFSSSPCCACRLGGWAQVLRCGPRLSFDFWTRKKRTCHIMINGQSEFSIPMKGERGRRM